MLEPEKQVQIAETRWTEDFELKVGLCWKIAVFWLHSFKSCQHLQINGGFQI